MQARVVQDAIKIELALGGKKVFLPFGLDCQ